MTLSFNYGPEGLMAIIKMTPAEYQAALAAAPPPYGSTGFGLEHSGSERRMLERLARMILSVPPSN